MPASPEATLNPLVQAFSSFSARIALSVLASAANLLIPSRSFSTAIACSLKSNLNFSSLLRYDFFSISNDPAFAAFSFLGMSSLLPYNSSRRFGCDRSTSARLSSLRQLYCILEDGTYRNGQIVAACQLCDLTLVPEAGTHDDGLVTEFLVVVEDLLHTLDTGIFLGRVLLLVGRLVPIQNAADKR